MTRMADLRVPAVTVDEGRRRLPVIAGVPTDVAGFVGVVERGPTAPTLVDSWTAFQDVFGGFVDRAPFVTPYWRLPYAVRGFFENGGARLYVARVLDALAPAADGDLDAVVGHAASGADAGTGIAGLMAIADISLMAVPDGVAAPAFAAALLEACDGAKDRVAIVDVPAGTVPRPGDRPRDTPFGAQYYPELHVPAAHRPERFAVAPACGHVAGCLAAAPVDAAGRPAPRLSPDSLVVEAQPGAETPLARIVPAAEADRLVLGGVNVIRDLRFADQGVRIWGARTMASNPEWKYVSVRRLIVYLERSIGHGLEWVVFEPNDDRTWTAVRAAVTIFLHALWRRGGLVGATPGAAYFVTCDRSTMTQDDLDNGRLICEVGVAPLKPAEFVILRIGQWTRRLDPDP